MPQNEIPEIKLNDGLSVPAIGFGTWPLKGSAGVGTIVQAIKNGYRLIDAAFNYENEGALGQALKKSGVPRDEILITSKLPGRRHKFEDAIVTIEESAFRAGVDHFDIYLIHWPNPKQGHYLEAWQGLIEARKRGLVRSIGVSNFLPEHLDRLVSETGVTPAINQIELHPFFTQQEQLAYDRSRGIVTEAWSPLGRASDVLKNDTIAAIASKHGKSIAQVILRWQTQLGALPLPKASSSERQIENLNIFDFTLTEADMSAITALGRPDGRIAGQDPATYEEF